MPHSTDDLTIEQLDVDGAIRETASRVDADTRAAFLRKAGVFGGSIAAGGALLGAPSMALGRGHDSDIDILNFALTLEYLEATFYHEAVRDAGLTDPQEVALARLVSDHEAFHVHYLKKALGRKAVRSPKFDFGSSVHSRQHFLNVAFTLENEGVAAYSGQGPRLKNVEYVKAAISILTIEARHASAFALIQGHIRSHNGITPNGPLDRPKSGNQVKKDVANTHYIVKS